MLFASKINEVNATIANISHEIEDLQARIEALRIEKLELEQYQQQLGSAENASESAIEQVKTALAMIKAISPDEKATFKDALISLFDDADIPLLASAEPDPDPEPSDDGGDDFAEYSVEELETALTKSAAVIKELDKMPDSSGNGHNVHRHIDVESFEIGVSDLTASLNKLGINELRKLAKKHRLDSKGAKFILIYRLIESGISEADLVAS
jgi:small-conductance mechanosensitive channel